MNKVQLAAALMSFGLVAGVAQAQSVDQRHAYQQERISRGVATGQLTAAEAARDERQQARIDRTEAHMRAINGGYLTASQRARLQHRENIASQQIYRTKHNARTS